MMTRSNPFLLAAAALAAGLLATPELALAHAKLKSSSPAANAKVPASLKTIRLEFSEAVAPEQSKFELDDGSGTAVLTTTGKDACVKATCKLTVPALKADKYTLKYHVLSADDGHVVESSFSFTVTG